MSQGILVARKDVSDEILYDSRKARLQIAIDRTPPHLGLENVSSTAIASDISNNYFARETIFTMKHDLGYKPKALVYFYNPSDGSYYVGRFYYGIGAAEDYLTYEVTEDTFRIVHNLDDSFFQIGITSTANTFAPIRVKFMLFSNPIDNLTPENMRV